MTPRERLMTALHLGKPDRLPISIHQWQGYHLDTYLGGITPLEAFRRFGLDAQIQHFQDMGQFWLVGADFERFSTPTWRDQATAIDHDPDHRVCHHVIHTPGGELTYKTEGNRKTTWITEYLIKDEDDLELIDRYMPVPDLDPRPVQRLHDEIGDSGILRGFVWGDQAGCWQHACCLIDVNDLLFRCFDQPDWVHRLLDILRRKKLEFIESMKGAPFDLVETGGGASSSTVVSPTLHSEFCLPYDRDLHDALHSQGFLVTYHTCGGTFGIEEAIVANRCDVSETLAPKSIGGNQEPWDFADKVAGRIALIGGLDQFNVVTDGPPDRIRMAVHDLFERVGPNGGYVCSLSDHFFDTPPVHLQAMADAARECAY